MTAIVPAERSLASPHPLSQAVVGVLAHNEEDTIEVCLRSIIGEPLVHSVVVVASGCTDRTVQIVNDFSSQDPRVSLITEANRSGKASAINLLLRSTVEPIVVIMGGDVVFVPGALALLTEPFSDPLVGMTGSRPIPTNPRTGIVGNAVNLLWDLHHEVSMVSPKLGEAVAFRRVPLRIDDRTSVDEASMEHIIRSSGLQLRYVPEAVVRNHGPETVREFIAQRTRVYQGHLSLRSQTGYQVSSMSARSAATATWTLWRRERRRLRHVFTTLVLEAAARMHAHAREALGRRPDDGIWQPLPTSKRVVPSGHTLRTHYHEIRTIQLPDVPEDRVAFRHSQLARIRRSVRSDDRISSRGTIATLTFRGDDQSARAVAHRLCNGLGPVGNSADDLEADPLVSESNGAHRVNGQPRPSR